VYLQLKRYPEAVTLLRLAVKLRPEQESLRKSLAMAYLYDDKDIENSDEVRKFVDQNADAGMLNDVAYQSQNRGNRYRKHCNMPKTPCRRKK